MKKKRERQFWKEIVVPSARGFERFFWNLLWFILFVCVLTSFNPFRQGTDRPEDSTETTVRHQTVSEQSENQQ